MANRWQLEEDTSIWELQENTDDWLLEEQDVAAEEQILLVMAPIKPGSF
jgi:hypothetical protein